jgi:hypothetical protein
MKQHDKHLHPKPLKKRMKKKIKTKWETHDPNVVDRAIKTIF